TTVAVGSSVDLVVSLGQPAVPDVVGQTEADANTAITAVDNLTVGTATYEYSDTVAAGNVISQNPAGGTGVAIGSSVDLVVSLGQPVVPDVVGQMEADANTAITAVDNLIAGSTIYEYSDTITAGLVISQSPVSGTTVAVGSLVDLVVSLGQPVVPDVVGQAEADANTAITAVDNLTVGSVTYEYSDTVASGNVISQNPAAGTTVPIGSSVDLVISLGQPIVPDVVGQAEADANSAITAVDNLTVGSVAYEYSDTVPVSHVISQNPAASTGVPIGSSVDIVVSLGQPVTPTVVGMTETDANSAIITAGLTVGTVDYEYNDIVAAGNVISQNPVGGTTVAVGSPVNLIVSLGQPVVPDVVGATQATAHSAITAVDNLAVGTTTYEYSDTVTAGLVISQNPVGGTTVTVGSSVDLAVSLGQPVVPNVVGMAEADANTAITAVDNLTVGSVTYEYSDTVAAGDVISQSPVGGTTVSVGSSVDLVVSLGQSVIVPNSVGQTEADANSAISAAGLLIGTVAYEYSDTVAAGLVISQSPVSGTTVAVGSLVDLVVSLGQPVVPNVVGQTEADANTAITAVDNLTVGSITYEYSDAVATGNVISQNPVASTAVAIGSSVDMVVSLGQPVVPDAVGQTEADANTAITAVDNLTVGSITYEYSDTVAAGIVISQNPVNGTTVAVGSSVDLVVSLGQPVVPDVVGMAEADANTAITAVDNLTIGSVTYEYSDTVAAGNVISQNPVGETVVPVGSSVELVASLGQPVVPNVVGMAQSTAEDAITAIDNLTVGNVTHQDSNTVPAGLVISQSPVGGTTVAVGSSVDLVVSLGWAVVPDVVGQSEVDANSAITAASLAIGTLTYEYSDTVATGNVISQNPIAGTSVTIGSSVDMVVSLGQPVAPDVVGQTEADANAAITAVDNLTVGSVTYEYSDTVAGGNVISQSPVAGTSVAIGSSV
ncbi:MAG: Stk1 family PASTA domain-containing Ser/Thr kinase, partial [Planctomycetota bacterium]